MQITTGESHVFFSWSIPKKYQSKSRHFSDDGHPAVRLNTYKNDDTNM